ncbi:MAG: DUF6112 family protein [Mycobacteriales bacterium]
MPTSILILSISVVPNQNLPGTTQIADLVGGLVTWVLYACIAVVLLGAAAWGVGHHGGSYAAEQRGRAMTLGGILGAIIAGAASALVTFGFNLGGLVH